MKIINRSDNKVSRKGIILNISQSVIYIALMKAKNKGILWDSRYISYRKIDKETSNGFCVSFMKFALYIGWTK